MNDMTWWDYAAYVDLASFVDHEPVPPEAWAEDPLTCKLMLADHMEEIGLLDQADKIRKEQKKRLE